MIKKYGNRRLYDTGDSRYVTLDELAAKIRAGTDIRVVDAQTDADLTQATLAQIVLETGNAAKFLPVQLLTQMIRLSDDGLAELCSRYLPAALEMYLQAKRGVQSLAHLGLGGPFAQVWSPFGGYPFGAPYAAPQQPGAAPQQSAAPPPPDAVEPPADDRRDVAALRRELDELKQALREGFAGRGRKKRKS